MVAREANGRASRKLAADSPGAYHPALIRRITDAAIAGMTDPFYGTALGNAYLRGLITTQQCAAGREWDRAYAAYLSAIGAPSPNPKSNAIGDSVRGMEPDPDSFEGMRRRRREIAEISRFHAMETVLYSCGLLIAAATRTLCESREIVSCSYEDLGRAKIGLQALHDHLSGPRKRVDAKRETS